MKPKEKELLSYLYQNRNRYLTSRQLADILQLSERTVRNYIRHIESEVQENGGRIIAKQGCGYRLELVRPVQFSILANGIQDGKEQGQDSLINSSKERRDYLLTRMLLNNEAVDLDKTASHLFVSLSTLKKEMASLKSLIEPYGLALLHTPEGTVLTGEENRKRSLIMDYFFRSASFNSLREYIDHSGYFDDIPTEIFLRSILNAARTYGVRLSDIMVQNVLLHLALAVKRIRSGLYLDSLPENADLAATPEYMGAREIIRSISEQTGMVFPEEEVMYLTLHLGGKSTDMIRINQERLENLTNEVETVLEQMAEDGLASLQDDELLKKSLVDHLKPMVTRVRNGIQQKNPLTESVMADRPVLFRNVRKYFGSMPSLRKYEITDDEWAYLALHVMAAMERQRDRRKLQVLVICATGFGSSQLLKSRLMNKFSDSLHIVSEAGYYDMNDNILQGIDLIISSVNMGPVIFGVPFLYVSVFLTDQDIEKIEQFIEHANSETAAPATANVRSRQERQQIFDHFFSEDRFTCWKEAPSRQEVMDTLTGMIAEGENENFPGHLHEQIRLREEMGSVVFSDTIAVPHPAMPLSRNSRIAVGLVPQGVAWNEDVPGLRLVLLMSPSYVDNENLTVVTNAIVDLIDAPQAQEQILRKGTFAEFRNVLVSLMI